MLIAAIDSFLCRNAYSNVDVFVSNHESLVCAAGLGAGSRPRPTPSRHLGDGVEGDLAVAFE